MKVKCFHMQQLENEFEQILDYQEWCRDDFANPSTHVTPLMLSTMFHSEPNKGA